MTIEHVLNTPIPRRRFIGTTAAITGASMAASMMSPSLAFATPNSPSDGDVVVFVFLRGGIDGLNLVAPYQMESYRQLRPTLRVQGPEEFGSPSASAGIPLLSGGNVGSFAHSGTFALHPGMQALYDGPWSSGDLAIIPAAGLPASMSTTRSHFDAMRRWEVGSSNVNTTTGFLNRYLSQISATASVPALGVGTNMPASLGGPVPAFALDNLAEFNISGFGEDDQAKQVLDAWHASGNDPLNSSTRDVLGVVDLVSSVPWNSATYAPNNGANYGYDPLASSLKQVAMATKANLGLRVAGVDMGGWDTHSNQGIPSDPDGYFRKHATRLSQSLSTFWTDLGSKMNEVTVVVVSEFGRTIAENGSGGTDHGRATTMMVMGKNVRGGIYGEFPTEIADGPHGDVEVLNDGRSVVAEVLSKRGGASSGSMSTIFPGWSAESLNIIG